MKSAFRRRCIANMHSKRGTHDNIRISGKRHTRIGPIVAQGEGNLPAPYRNDGTMEAYVFENWFEDELLKNLPKAHVMIMDNASFHKKEVYRTLRENTRKP